LPNTLALQANDWRFGQARTPFGAFDMAFVHFAKAFFQSNPLAAAPPLTTEIPFTSTPLRVKDFALLFRLFETFCIFAKATVCPKPCT